jgi:hypothetical protein
MKNFPLISDSGSGWIKIKIQDPGLTSRSRNTDFYMEFDKVRRLGYYVNKSVQNKVDIRINC